MSQGAALSKPVLEVASRPMLTVAVMIATIMQVLDTTIANVALPHMAASLGATQDEVTWVLTSYIVSSAIATPLTGWVAENYGRRFTFLVAIIGFVATSVACGLSTSLPEMVFFRILQGIFGAVLIPLSQAVMLDINPRERMGQAMAVYGAGLMLGPIIGPTLGGYLTESFDWRYVFFINLPVGMLAFAGIMAFLPKEETTRRRFDIFGFSMLAVAIGSLQLLLDRGQNVDWFNSLETWIYLGLIIIGLWVFLVHILTAANPFVAPRMFTDLNYAMGLVFIFIIGITLFSGLALLPPMLQQLMGYPVISTGLVMAPRGIGTMASMIVVGRLVGRIDSRVLVAFGVVATTVSMRMMAGFSTDMDDHLIITSGVLQGFGLGFIFVPLSTLAFATIEQKYRGDATSFFSLVRNVGSGVGISLVTTVLSRMSAVNHEELASRITAAAPQVRSQMPELLHGSPLYLYETNQLVTQQATMLGYVDNFMLMTWLSAAVLPLVLLLRNPKHGGRPAGPPPASE